MLLKLPYSIQLSRAFADEPVGNILDIPQRNIALEIIPEEASSKEEASVIMNHFISPKLMIASSFKVSSENEQRLSGNKQKRRRKSMDEEELDSF